MIKVATQTVPSIKSVWGSGLLSSASVRGSSARRFFALPAVTGREGFSGCAGALGLLAEASGVELLLSSSAEGSAMGAEHCQTRASFQAQHRISSLRHTGGLVQLVKPAKSSPTHPQP